MCPQLTADNFLDPPSLLALQIDYLPILNMQSIFIAAKYTHNLKYLNAIITISVIMEIVTIDNSGRLVIPEFIRKKLHLSKNVPLLIMN